MLKAFNVILTTPPKYEDNDLVAFPFNAILDWPMGTASGYSMFQDKDVNARLGAILNAYGEFLKDEKQNSNAVLIPHEGYLADPKGMMFYDLYKCPDKSAKHYGFKSFDAWFTREFKDVEKVRPVAEPNDNSVISAACESTVYRNQPAKQNDTFWLKGQPYSLRDMLYDDELAPGFKDGHVYQAFLSASIYHRWNSPINGTIRKVVQVPGYPFVESYYEGFANIAKTTGEPDPDPAATDRSQSFITSVATRALVFIDADDANIGLMCFIAVGMADVSSCVVHKKWQKGVHIKKGDELGTFHFGGSTHCLIFREGVKINFHVQVGDLTLLNSKVGTAVKA
jgi:phosphatidylserine decarboxylase